MFCEHLESIYACTKKTHWDVSLLVVRYLKNNSILGLLFSSNKSLQLRAYCDANCPMTRRSTLGYYVFLDFLISSKIIKHKTVLRSSEHKMNISQ